MTISACNIPLTDSPSDGTVTVAVVQQVEVSCLYLLTYRVLQPCRNNLRSYLLPLLTLYLIFLLPEILVDVTLYKHENLMFVTLNTGCSNVVKT
jgi:hypothetical protein